MVSCPVCKGSSADAEQNINHHPECPLFGRDLTVLDKIVAPNQPNLQSDDTDSNKTMLLEVLRSQFCRNLRDGVQKKFKRLQELNRAITVTYPEVQSSYETQKDIVTLIEQLGQLGGETSAQPEELESQARTLQVDTEALEENFKSLGIIRESFTPEDIELLSSIKTEFGSTEPNVDDKEQKTEGHTSTTTDTNDPKISQSEDNIEELKAKYNRLGELAELLEKNEKYEQNFDEDINDFQIKVNQIQTLGIREISKKLKLVDAFNSYRAETSRLFQETTKEQTDKITEILSEKIRDIVGKVGADNNQQKTELYQKIDAVFKAIEQISTFIQSSTHSSQSQQSGDEHEDRENGGELQEELRPVTVEEIVDKRIEEIWWPRMEKMVEEKLLERQTEGVTNPQQPESQGAAPKNKKSDMSAAEIKLLEYYNRYDEESQIALESFWKASVSSTESSLKDQRLAIGKLTFHSGSPANVKYWIFEIENKLYLVPKKNLNLEVNQYSSKTFKNIFEVQGAEDWYQPLLLIKPAIVSYDSHQGIWTLETKGIITFESSSLS